MKILLVQDTDWLARNIHQHHHVGERLCVRGHDLTVIDHDLLWRTNGGKLTLFSKRQVFRRVSKVVRNAHVTVIRPGIVRLPFLAYASMLVTYSREISAQLRKSPPDVVIGMYILTNYLALRESKKRGIPFVFQVLEPNYEMIPSKLLRPIGKLIERRIFRDADKVVVINEGLTRVRDTDGSTSRDDMRDTGRHRSRTVRVTRRWPRRFDGNTESPSTKRCSSLWGGSINSQG